MDQVGVMTIEHYHVLITEPLFALNIKCVLRTVDFDGHHQAQFLDFIITHASYLINLVPIGHGDRIEV